MLKKINGVSVGSGKSSLVRPIGATSYELVKLMVDKQITHIDIKTAYAELEERMSLTPEEKSRKFTRTDKSGNSGKEGYFANEVRTAHDALIRGGVFKRSNIRSIWNLTESPRNDKWFLAKQYLATHPYKPSFQPIVLHSFMTNLAKYKNSIPYHDLKAAVKIEIKNSGFQFTQASFNQTFSSVKTTLTQGGIIKPVNGLHKDAVIELTESYLRQEKDGKPSIK